MPFLRFGIFWTAFWGSEPHLEYSEWHSGCRNGVRNIPNTIPAACRAFEMFQKAGAFSGSCSEYSK
ncbi:MAG: hypothetical protein GC192_18130 [Bacteroidetes bacterium]|nr:hypothetical protein [Bacteroidota bacterium]